MRNPLEPKKTDKKPLNQYAKYSSIAFEMIATILLFVWFGKWLDSKFVFSFPLYTTVFALVGVLAAMYRIINSLKK